MKILVTGGTSTLVGAGTLMKIQGFSTPLTKCLRAMGHQVDQRPVVPGEDLSKYDCSLVGMAPFYSIGARWTFGAYYALSLIADGTIPGAILANDWDLKTPFHEPFMTVNNHWKDDNFVAKISLPRFNRPEFFDHIDRFWKLMEHFVTSNSWPGFIAPCFDWPGTDHELLLAEAHEPKFKHKAYIDPTPWVETYASVTDDTVKERQWISASLHPADAWRQGMNLTWPVYEFGTVSRQQIRLKEQEVIDLYGRSWGLLSHPYYMSGSGWWRNRFNYGAASGTIILAAPYEVGAAHFGENPLCPDPVEVEGLSDAELRNYAFAQWAWLDSHAWTHERMASEVQQFLDSITTEHAECLKLGSCETQSTLLEIA